MYWWGPIDRTFRLPAIILAERAAERGVPVWMYRFDWSSPEFGGQLKACHALVVPFVWNNLDKPGVAMLTGDSPVRQEIAEAMHAAWIALRIRVSLLLLSYLSGLFMIRGGGRRCSLMKNNQVVNDPQRAERLLWEGGATSLL